jgi:hypothetical protein
LEDPWLKKNMPPNGFGCNCSTRAISSYRLKKEGLLAIPQEIGKTPSVAEDGWDYDMCGSEMEHIEKIESVERKRADKGDKISELALFENAYKRMKHFQELCNSETQDNSEDYDGDCIEANRRFEKYKIDIMNSSNPYILKGTLSYLNFTEREEITDFSILACALASHYPGKSVKYRKFSKMSKSRVGNMMMGISKENRHFMIREDILENLNIALEKIKREEVLKFQDIDTLLILWHELLHLEQSGSKKFSREDIRNILGEIINELTARHTLKTLLKDIGAKYDETTLKDVQINGSGYKFYIKRFIDILKLLDIDEKEFVGDGSLNRDLDWEDAVSILNEKIARSSKLNNDFINQILSLINIIETKKQIWNTKIKGFKAKKSKIQ